MLNDDSTCGPEILKVVQAILYKLFGNVLLIDTTKCLACFFLHQRLEDSSQLLYVYILFHILASHEMSASAAGLMQLQSEI